MYAFALDLDPRSTDAADASSADRDLKPDNAPVDGPEGGRRGYVLHLGLCAVQTAEGMAWRETWGSYGEGHRLGMHRTEDEARARVAFWQEHGR